MTVAFAHLLLVLLLAFLARASRELDGPGEAVRFLLSAALVAVSPWAAGAVLGYWFLGE